MRISILREFVALSENLHFGKTARQLYITESTLSKHIALLENHVGAVLLNRSHYKVELTPIGRIFVKEAEAILKRYDDGMKTVEILLKELEKELKVGYLSAQFRKDLISAIPCFRSKFPCTDFVLIDGEYGELFQKLYYDDIDVLLTLNFEKYIPDQYRIYRLGKNNLHAAICSNNPLALKASISLEDLRSERLLLPDMNKFKGFGSFIRERLEEDMLKYDRHIVYNRMTSALLMVESEGAIALVPETLNVAVGENVRFVPLKEDQFAYDVVAVWKNINDNASIYEFIQILSKSMHKN